MTLTAGTSKKTKQFFPIYLETLRVDSALAFDLYIEASSEYVLYRSVSQPFTDQHRQHLLENNVGRLFVSADDQTSYQHYLESNLNTIIRDKSVSDKVKAGIVYESAKFLVADIFANPAVGENIKRGEELVKSTVGFILTGSSAFASLLSVMSFDYSTYTHSVNVCTLSLALAQSTGIRNPRDLKVLGTGALLHDIGKTKVGDSILNKAGPLTDAEMDLVRRHPQWGYDIVKETDLVDTESYFPILQHHERDNQSGYPEQCGGNKIHRYAKITAIADVFDAMTTERVYRNAADAYPALKEMFADVGAFDRELLEQFTKMFELE